MERLSNARSFRRSAAIQHYETAVRMLREAKVTPDIENCQYLYTGLNRALEAQDRLSEAAALYQELQALAVT